MSEPLSNLEDIKKAFVEYDRRVILNNVKIGCFLGVVLMPAGTVLDNVVYHSEVFAFLKLRLLCSALIGLFWAIVLTPIGHKHPRKLGVLLAMIPSFFISWMVYEKEGSSSPYYAGLNLVLLLVGFVLHWTFYESLVAVSSVMLMYIGACFLHGGISQVGFVNNIYFLVLTGIIVVTGSYFHSLSRFREFELRYELDKSRSLLKDNNEKLMELDQVKNRFFANISHELRTPLTLLLSPLETMLNDRTRNFDPQTLNLFSIMHGNGMRLLKLINDLLDLVRLESGRMEVKREPLEMSAFVKGLTGAAQQMADAKGLRLETTVEPGLGPLLVDRDKLEKTILNLVFNALKFTPAGGLVALHVEKNAGELVISVKDTGVGISEKNLPFVFDRFWQADDSSKRKFQGVGIGLSLVKELTEVQGGKVAVVSQLGKGTTFTVILPFLKADLTAVAKPEEKVIGQEPASGVRTDGPPAVQSEEWLANLYRRAVLFPAAAPSQEAAAVAATSKNGSHPTLLVADDEPDMLRFLKSQLSSQYHVLEAVDGLQAFQKATESLPDIILLDMNMPEKDGLQVCRELREQPSTQGIPIILLTARADEQTKLDTLSAGANDFLTKPFSTSELHMRIKNLVESHHYKEKLAKQNQTLESTIDQLKETETLLVQTEKMASLGRMSAGIIHEINNPLNYATTGLFTLRNKTKLLAPEQQAVYTEILSDVEEGIQRVMSIVSDLKSFTHPDTEQLDFVEVSSTVGSALKFLSSEWKDTVEIRQNLPEHIAIHGNRNKLLQVFVNLLQNSLDATRRKTFTDEKPTIWIEGSVDADKTVVTVRDNGEGIAAESLNKVFDPFFTTKDVGEGMGLGLTICYRIIQEYKGLISVQSELGKFCRIELEFPAQALDINAANKTNQVS
ncbi:MAG: Integral rane sensor hybrid histidine kinase [Pedosphaera sp.]|nr:Integral rane sensor hybrid histidine kinase [Pedosphaera sp.]